MMWGGGGGHVPPSQSVDEGGLAALGVGDNAVEAAGPGAVGVAAGAADDGGPWREGEVCPAHAKGMSAPKSSTATMDQIVPFIAPL